MDGSRVAKLEAACWAVGNMSHGNHPYIRGYLRGSGEQEIPFLAKGYSYYHDPGCRTQEEAAEMEQGLRTPVLLGVPERRWGKQDGLRGCCQNEVWWTPRLQSHCQFPSGCWDISVEAFSEISLEKIQAR